MLSVLAVSLAVLVGAALQSATGFGFALVSAPVLFAVFSPGEALTTLVLLAGMLSMLVLFGERRDVSVRRSDVARLVAWGVPGLAVGAMVLRAVDKPALQVGVGVAVVSAVLIDTRGRGAVQGGKPWPVAPVGLAAGALTTTTGVNGPPMVIYFLRSGADRHAIRDSLAAAFLLFTPLSLVALAAAGRLGFGHVRAAELAGLLVLVLVGRPLGRALFLRMSPLAFRRAGIGLALVAGVASVVAGLTS